MSDALQEIKETKEAANELIQLASAHATQYTDSGVKGDWHIRENITSEALFDLPGRLSEQEVFHVLDRAREYELKAFNAGIKFQKSNQNKLFVAQIAELKEILRAALVENERLAGILESTLPGEHD